MALNPPAASKAKILEIGCSFGGNLIPFALNNKEATLVGIDISGTQISQGQKIIDDMGIKNLKLFQKDVCELDDNGKFDYIIAHGVYSWVPEHVREGILRVIKNLLNPNGLAYVSYNVYPGWKNKSILRDIISTFLPMSEQMSPQEQVKLFRDNINFLKGYIKALDIEVKQSDLISLIDRISKKSDHYIFHEYFAFF